jgi:hypothetical protein
MGRIFYHWAIGYFTLGSFFFNRRIFGYSFFPLKNVTYVLVLTKKCVGLHFGRFLTNSSGVITIFYDFRQFSAKKLAFFSKTNVMIKILHNLALFKVKNANFSAKIFLKS